jgi:hypothetical protein
MILSALARLRPSGASISGDTIAAVPYNPHPIQLCVEDRGSHSVAIEAPTNLFKVRLANTEERRSNASYLIKRRYAWRGYSVNEQPRPTPNRITIAAQDDDGVVGTLTVGLDSAEGLFVDGLFGDEADALRTEGRKLAEFTKLAIENNAHSKPLLAALFHVAFIYARRISRCTDLLIEVAPRHDEFYRRMLGFERIGPMRDDTRVGTPALLLRLCLAHAEEEIGRLGGNPSLGLRQRSLYPYAFAAREEALIERRLRALG